MKLKLCLFSFISLVFLVACSEETYDKNELIATFKGVDIKVNDILTQYPIEDEYIEIFLKEEIVINEAKTIGITVSQQKLEELKQTYYPSGEGIQIEDFHKEQAEILGITPKEYYEMWSLTYLERNEYIQEYIKTKFDEPASIEDGEKWGKEIEEHINKLFTNYIDNNDLIIYI
ncbi:hypothetical protein FZC76_18515 [Sutcliffiella horikoshii]|uniref:Lipoprotein n=1 Tax=Sutcliffiella horikoshii TaxID=79883 RepID=A0A5D4SMP7_9BACI|nr:hypothetical protein [Sutcliffiella horikoshii]TYS64553.1 hypothetical protein FZC76_18515 [Sutcliffiella horikoshii]